VLTRQLHITSAIADRNPWITEILRMAPQTGNHLYARAIAGAVDLPSLALPCHPRKSRERATIDQQESNKQNGPSKMAQVISAEHESKEQD
jgi:hypothetical protein